MSKSQPDYKRIYTDIINKKYPQKRIFCQSILEKNDLSALDVIKLNTLIFDAEKNVGVSNFNHSHRSYDQSAIIEILDYQLKNRLNNTQIANYFKISRNTLAKWKKIFRRL